MTRTSAGETWVRDFAGRRFRSHLTPAGAGRVRESFGILTFEIDLPAADGVLPYVVRRGWCLGLPLPRFLLPRVETREFEEDSRFRFDVRLAAPVTGALIVHYRGWLTQDA